MSLKPLLVSPSTVKKYGVIEANVDDKLISQTILMVQDTQLQQILGSDLYNELLDQFKNNNLSEENVALLTDYIRDYMINQVQADGVFIFNYRFSNKGIVTQNSETQFPVTRGELELLEQRFSRQAEFYAKRLSKFLLQNTSTYPKFLNGNDQYQDLQSKVTSYNTGMFLGNVRRKKIENKRDWYRRG